MPTRNNKKNPIQPPTSKLSAGEIESYLINLEKATDEETAFWDEYERYYAQEREKIIVDIAESMMVSSLENGVFEKCSRIVSAKYSGDPLCTLGSILISSNRFNFGSISSSLTSFQALYAGENFGTAYFEKYGFEVGTRLGSNGYDPSILRAQPGNFAHFELDIKLDTYLDIRKIQTLQPFVDAIRTIEVPERFVIKARKIFGGRGNLSKINTISKLKRSLLHREQAQWPTLLNQPSNPQWFGHYAKESGLSGIVYPSVRSKLGFNVVLFTDNLKGSGSYARLTGNWPAVPADRRELNSRNADFMKFDPPPPGTH